MNNPNSSSNPTSNLVETVAAQTSFKTFDKALRASGLADTLKGPGPFTVFAPTDAAFAKLPAGKLDAWLKPENKAELISVLKYHVTPGRLMASDIRKMETTQTVLGQAAKIRSSGDKVTIDAAGVSLTDIASSNGVIHPIDAVLIPTKH